MAAGDDQLGSVLLDALRGVLAGLGDPVQVLRTILAEAVQRTGADRGLFVEVEDDGALTFRVLHRFEPGELRGEAGAFSRSVFERVLSTGKSLLIENALTAPSLRDARSVQQMRLVSVLCAPIRAGEKTAALVHLENAKAGHFDASHQRLLESLAQIAGPVLATLNAGRRVLDERDAARAALAEERAALASEWSFGRFVGRSPAVQTLHRSLHRAAASDFPVLLAGETGTGKGLLARILHAASPRAAKPLVTVFCPSLERGMVESELFGHRRGAFTGATEDRAGKVQTAEGGTLFLDEIGELPLEIQPKILRLLQEKTYERLGDAQERRADVRIVAATNRDLAADVAAGRFRRDLFERLNYLPLRVPPLRERRADVPLLLRHALDHTAEGRWIAIAPEADAWLAALEFVWPGNVRNVEQLAARLSVEATGTVNVNDLAPMFGELAPATGPDVEGTSADGPKGAGTRGDDGAPAASFGGGLGGGLGEALERAERDFIAAALRAHPGITRRDLAALLEISEPALYRKLRQYGLN